jgi:hypothetical protein
MPLTESQLAELPEGWCATDRPSGDCDISHVGIAEEVAVEVSAGHPLFGVPVEVVAHDVAFDDVLCRHVADPERFTEVDVTWAGRAESFGLPSIECDGTWEDFLRLQQSCAPRLAHPTPSPASDGAGTVGALRCDEFGPRIGSALV